MEYQGFRRKLHGCIRTSSETKDYINGNYSKTLIREIRYTGENIDVENAEPYEITYTMSFSQKNKMGRNVQVSK